MSAIVGILNFNKEQPVSIDNGNSMMGSLQEFPSDDIQTWYKGNIFLGCHAQWITPESVGEQLPHYDHERRLAITADAIIDNRTELFDKLGIKKSHREGMPDSILILLAYEKWGEESPKHLFGDFAYMIWDERTQELFGARDFSGSRTLYYHQDINTFIFSTTIKPILTSPNIKKEVNNQWLAEFLAIPDMFNSVDIHSTPYKNIKQIPPSHSVRINNKGTSFSRYCSFNNIKKLRLKSNEEYVEAFNSIFNRAVNDRLRTYKEVGSHLSGGLDSGSVVAFAAKSLKKENKKLYTFSYVPLDGFKDWTPKSRIANESYYINDIVKYVSNCEHEYLNFENKSSFNDIDQWVKLIEMPYKFFINSYWIKGIHEKASDKDIKILLSGARGNYTVSWGSSLDYYAVLMKKFKYIKLMKEINIYSKKQGIGRKHLMIKIGKKAYPNLSNVNAYNKPFPTIINQEFAERTKVYQKLRKYGIDVLGIKIPDSYEARERQFENLFYWGNGVSGTNLSLKYSLWNRDPTNDLRVVKFCLSLPYSQYVQNGLDRSLIRRATEGLLPVSVRLNNSKRGVQGADGISRMASHWHSFFAEINELCSDENLAQYLNIETLKLKAAKFHSNNNPEILFNPDFKILMRSLIIYRFMKICF